MKAAFSRAATLAFAALAALHLAGGQVRADDEEAADDRGLTEYEISCMKCHGPDGKGDGPTAARLTKPPADLTRIAKANGGVFPEKRVREMIDGRSDVAAHGLRQMPVWGARYRTSADPGDRPKDVDKRAKALIEQLVAYLKTIQER